MRHTVPFLLSRWVDSWAVSFTSNGTSSWARVGMVKHKPCDQSEKWTGSLLRLCYRMQNAKIWKHMRPDRLSYLENSPQSCGDNDGLGRIDPVGKSLKWCLPLFDWEVWFINNTANGVETASPFQICTAVVSQHINVYGWMLKITTPLCQSHPGWTV